MKAESVNLYRERIYQAQLFIENNLHRDFTLEDAARAACFSCHHFHRLFSVYTGEGVFTYTRRLRLQKAAERLCLNGISVEEAAVLANYSTVAAFTKAFTAHFGTSPAAYKRQMQAQRRVNLSSVNNCTAFEYKRIEPELLFVESFDVVCIRQEGSCLSAGYGAWSKLESIICASGIDWQPLRKFGCTVDSPDINEDTKVRYDAGVVLDGLTIDNNYLFRQHFGSGEYAVFTHYGSYETLWQTYLGICLGWLPQSEAVLRETCWFDEYVNRPGEVTPAGLITRIHVPVET